VRARTCDSFLSRLRGLTFRRTVAPDEGLLLVERKEGRLDASIHMLAVFTDLAVVWVNSDREVVDVRLARRWRPAYVPRKPARFVLELAPERLADFQIGDRLSFDGEIED
jgi:uncharacterized membrane protein (UPF0127 family)